MDINTIGIGEARALLRELHEAGRCYSLTGDDAEVVRTLDKLDRYFEHEVQPSEEEFLRASTPSRRLVGRTVRSLLDEEANAEARL